MRPFLLAAMLCASLPANAINIRVTLNANQDGIRTTAYPCVLEDRSDCAPPTTGTLTYSATAASLTSLVGLNTGSSYSENSRAHFSGSAAASCTLSVVTVSGDSASGKNWSISGSNLQNTGVSGSVGAGVLKERCTTSGNNVDGPDRAWSFISPVTDTTAPTQITGLSAALNGSNQPVLTFDEPCDPFASGGSGGLASYIVSRDGVALTPVSISGSGAAAYTSLDIGTLSPTGTSSQSGADWLQTAEGQLNSGTGNDEFRFSYRSTAGDFKSSFKIESITNGSATLARGGVMARTDTSQQSAFVMAQALSQSVFRLQYRPTQGATRSAIGSCAVTFPASGQLVRVGDDWTLQTSADGNNWQQCVTLNQPMASSLLTGLATASQSDGVATSVQYRNVCTRSGAQITYTDTGASSGVTHNYTVKAKDAANNTGADSASVSIAVPSVPTTNAIKWHPGHYKFNQNQQAANNTVSTSFYTNLDSEASAIKGIMQPYYWAALEPSTAGNYDWSKLDSKLALLKARGKRMIVYLRTRSCCTAGTTAVNYIPTYIITDYGTAPYSYGTAAKIWESATMDRVIALYRAIAERYDSEPAFEGIATDETALGFGTTPPTGYGQGAQVTQYARLLAAWREAAPHTQMWVFGNYLGNQDDSTLLQQIYVAARDSQNGIGGPDSPPGRPIEGFKTVQGIWPVVAPFGHDFRPELSQLYVSMSYLPYYTGETGATTFAFVKDTLQAGYAVWKPHTDGTTLQNWPAVQAVITANPTFNATCPTSFAACDTSN